MIIEMKREGAVSANSTASSPSPVTWHAIFWVLLSLAINSMAQPSGRLCGIITVRSRLRIYFCSSPILCLADALEMFARFLATTIYLKLSPRKACRLVVLGRSDEAFREGPASILHLNCKPSQELEIERSRWPRWVFFITGTLPAAIKLASFSGTPCTKTWGLMFVTSFVAIELFGVVGQPSDTEHPSSVAAVLGLSDIEWEHPENAPLRETIKALNEAIAFGDLLLLMIALCIHVGVVIWAAGNLWSMVLDNDDILFVTGFIKAFVALWMMVLFFGGLLLKRIGKFPSGVSFPRLLVVSFYALILTPEKRTTVSKTGKTFSRLVMKRSVMLIIFAIFWLCRWLMTLLCRQWPWVGRALLIDNKAGPPGGVENQPGDSIERAVKSEIDPIDGGGWAALCFFIANLSLCAIWYGFLYDPTETANPSWTDVFG